MIETQATVTGLDGAYALVEASEVGCGRCHEKGGCGGNNASQLFCQAPRRFRVRNPLGALVGDRVAIGVPDGAVARSVLILYVLPLILIILGAVLGAALFPGRRDAMAGLGAVLGGVLGWFVARGLQQRSAMSPLFEPVIRQRL